MAHDPVKRHPAELPLLVIGSVILVVPIPVLAAVLLEVLGVGWMVVFFAAFPSLYLGRGLAHQGIDR